jgi:hypothetical protein
MTLRRMTLRLMKIADTGQYSAVPDSAVPDSARPVQAMETAPDH